MINPLNINFEDFWIVRWAVKSNNFNEFSIEWSGVFLNYYTVTWLFFLTGAV